MKKGKRQIVDKNIFEPGSKEIPSNTESFNIEADPQSLSNSSVDNNNRSPHSSEKDQDRQKPAKINPVIVPALETQLLQKDTEGLSKVQARDQTSISPISEVKKVCNASKSINSRSRDGEIANSNGVISADEQKKNRIEMLKQKYLKKSGNNQSQAETKMLGAESGNQKNITQDSSLKAEYSFETMKIQQKKSEIILQKNRPIKIDSVQAALPKVIEVKQVIKDIKHQQIKLKQLQIIKNVESYAAQPINLNQNQMTQPQKKASKVPPPIPKKIEQKRNNNRIPPPPPPGKPINRNKINEQSQSPQILPSNQNKKIVQQPSTQIFQSPFTKEPETVQMPPNGQKDEVNEIEQQQVSPVKSKVPPPPKKNTSRSNTVQQILARRLKKQQNVSKQQTKMQDNYEPQDKTEPYCPVSNIVSMDQEYSQSKQQKIVQSRQTFASAELNLSTQELIQLWISNPSKALAKLTPFADKILNSIQPAEEKQQPFIFQSKNPHFNGIISKIISSFVIGFKGELSASQKEIIYELALQYFYSNAKELTTQFLFLLVKLGQFYFQKYSQFFKKSNQTYLSNLIANQSLFSQQQLALFTNFIIDIKQLRQEEYYLLIILSPTQKLMTAIINKNINSPTNMILMLLACHFVLKKNKSITGLYLKRISNVVDIMPEQYATVELILKYLNQMEIVQKYYHIAKQLKLKIIGIISNKGNKVDKKTIQSKDNKTSTNKSETDGFMGYFSKAVDKIKTATSQLTIPQNQTQKQKPKEVQIKQEEPEDQIVYDPVLKRYRINGKIPIDQDNHPGDAARVPPPPPPPKTGKPIAPPPAPGNKKPRAMNTNRYA